MREREKEWNRRRIAEARAGLVLEAQLARRRKDEMKKLAQENRQLAEEQLARWSILIIQQLNGLEPEWSNHSFLDGLHTPLCLHATGSKGIIMNPPLCPLPHIIRI